MGCMGHEEGVGAPFFLEGRDELIWLGKGEAEARPGQREVGSSMPTDPMAHNTAKQGMHARKRASHQTWEVAIAHFEHIPDSQYQNPASSRSRHGGIWVQDRNSIPRRVTSTRSMWWGMGRLPFGGDVALSRTSSALAGGSTCSTSGHPTSWYQLHKHG